MTGLYLRFHRWHGFALTNIEPDLFSYVFKLGFVTVYVCRACVLEAYLRIKATVRQAVSLTDQGR